MTSFRRSLFGYSRPEVEAALTARDSRISGLEQHSAAVVEQNAALEAQSLVQAQAIASHEADLTTLSGMVIERERTIRSLTERLEEANACHDRSIASLDAVSARLEELQAQARGQATRIRMKALREAVEVGRRAQELAEVEAVEGEAAPEPTANGSANGSGRHEIEPGTSWEPGLYEGKVRLEIGPLGDFSQLLGFEDAVGRLGATDIAVERFSEGRATFSMRLAEPVDLLRELESHSDLDFTVRHTAPDNLVLEVEDEGPDLNAA